MNFQKSEQSPNQVVDDSSLKDYQNSWTETDHQTLLHDTAHVFASALKRLYGNKIQITIGPSIRNGFYYDIDADFKITSNDFEVIEKEMMKVARENKRFIKEQWSKEKALDYFKSIGEDYKVAIIKDLKDEIFIYRNGDFLDLCKGPHLDSTKHVRHFKLLKVAGAYWRGSSDNKMLQRIYGTSFFTKAELDNYLFLQSEAEKRDHRRLGKELDLFHFQEEAQGSPFWHSKGWTINLIIEKYIRQILKEDGYKEVKTPILYDRGLWEKSGHWDKFSDNMFSFKEKASSVIESTEPTRPTEHIEPTCITEESTESKKDEVYVSQENIQSIHLKSKTDDNQDICDENEKSNMLQDKETTHLKTLNQTDVRSKLSKSMVLKPMNCPAHVQIFNQEIRSYRELPLRLSEFGICHRNEPTGALYGLMRVRSFRQDDGHIFCTFEQIKDETVKFIKSLLRVYEKFGFNKVKIKFSDRPDIRSGTDEVWTLAENSLLSALQDMKLNYELNKGEGAFYGPKLEFTLTDALDREWQCGTVQIDMVLPERLNAKYISETGAKKNCVMIHRAFLGSFERFIGILIEHYSGKLPFWLSPVQIAILKVSDDIEEINEYALKVFDMLDIEFRVYLYKNNERIGKKIAEMTSMKIPVLVIIGKEEASQNLITLRIENIKHQISISQLVEFLTEKKNQ